MILDEPGWGLDVVPFLLFGGLLALHGIATLQRADPARGVVLLIFGQRMGVVNKEHPLDERDLLLRHRAFTTSYALLFGLLSVMTLMEIGVRLLEFPRRPDFSRLDLLPLWLAPLLPSLVLPWLERDEKADEEPIAQARYPTSGEATRGFGLYPGWIRILASDWVFWALIASALIWLFHQSPTRHCDARTTETEGLRSGKPVGVGATLGSGIQTVRSCARGVRS